VLLRLLGSAWAIYRTDQEAAEKHLFHALRFLHPSKPKPGLPGARRYAHACGSAELAFFNRFRHG
jgi:hypothetical protein